MTKCVVPEERVRVSVVSNVKVFLEEVHIKHLLSLRDVVLPLKQLTVLVGPNASGKSNVLSALSLLNGMMTIGSLPPIEVIQDSLWAGEDNNIYYQLQTKVNETPTVYELGLRVDADSRFVTENLSVKNVEVISVQNGEGVVRDEDGRNKTSYRSNKLAVKSAGDYGNKPITNLLTKFITGWVFYDFRPEYMRRGLSKSETIIWDEFTESHESIKLDIRGTTLSALHLNWHKNNRERFESVSESLADSTSIRIDHSVINGDDHICLLEGYENPIPLPGASDGTLRLVAYYILLNQPELPPLIAIEEPERNLHPGALTEIADVLERIAEQSQVIITTHSSQLLDAFKSERLSDSLCVLLLRNLPGIGTEVFNLEEILHDREALEGWISTLR